MASYHRRDVIGGRYAVQRALSGGMGEVYLCTDQREDVPVAPKTFSENCLRDTDRRSLQQQFEQMRDALPCLERAAQLGHLQAVQYAVQVRHMLECGR